MPPIPPTASPRRLRRAGGKSRAAPAWARALHFSSSVHVGPETWTSGWITDDNLVPVESIRRLSRPAGRMKFLCFDAALAGRPTAIRELSRSDRGWASTLDVPTWRCGMHSCFGSCPPGRGAWGGRKAVRWRGSTLSGQSQFVSSYREIATPRGTRPPAHRLPPRKARCGRQPLGGESIE